MQLLNVGFAILILKISISVLPIVAGIFLIFSSEEKKRDMRNAFCNKMFGVSNAIAYAKFARFLNISAVLLMTFGLLAGWLLLLRS